MQIGSEMAALQEKTPKMDPKKRFFWKIPQDFELLKKVPQNIHQTGQFGWNRYIGIWNLSHGAFQGDVSETEMGGPVPSLIYSNFISPPNPTSICYSLEKWIGLENEKMSSIQSAHNATTILSFIKTSKSSERNLVCILPVTIRCWRQCHS